MIVLLTVDDVTISIFSLLFFHLVEQTAQNYISNRTYNCWTKVVKNLSDFWSREVFSMRYRNQNNETFFLKKVLTLDEPLSNDG